MHSPSEIELGSPVYIVAGARIMEAAAGGDLEKLKEIRERIGDDGDFRRRCDLVTDHEGRRVLHYAAGMGRTEMCRFLIEEVEFEIDVKTHRGVTPLLHAVKEGHIEIAEYLINRGAEIRMKDAKGLTSLHYAVEKDDKELMQLLLMKGASIEAISVRGTPLQCAASSGNVETVKLLLDHGAEPNTICLLFGSPLICAIISHSFECVELLLKAGADPNKGLHGLSPLAHAAAEGQTKCLKALLAAGANPDSDGLRPIDHAALKHNHECVRILFPVSERIPIPDWSVDGVMEFFHSEKSKTMREQMRNCFLDFVKQRGKNAWSRLDYFAAAAWFSEALHIDPSDEKLLSNRSLCWARLGEAAFALHDAEECVRLRPNWAKAHYREGAAWKLLGNHRLASLAFGRASGLDPQSDEIENAYRESSAAFLVDMAARFQLDVVGLVLNTLALDEI